MGIISEIILNPVFLWVICILAGSGIILWIVSYFVASNLVFNSTLRRKSKDKWSREMPKDIDPEQIPMYEAGVNWSEQHKDKKTDVHIVRDGLNLYGEYYDLGNKKCVMILSGRTESLRYGYYFGIPYAERGYNVLVVDPRAHGMSDGEFNTVGFEESLDDVEWVNMLVNEFGMKSVIFHGICIGAAGGILALTSGKLSCRVDGIVTEGMYPNFGESMKNHMRERKKPIFITYQLINGLMKRHTGHSMNIGPIDFIHKLDKPLLMLHSREDKYSTPKYAQKLYDKAGCKNKRLVWFDHGRHSMLRITDTQKYDTAIGEFLENLNNYNNTNEKENNYVL